MRLLLLLSLVMVSFGCAMHGMHGSSGGGMCGMSSHDEGHSGHGDITPSVSVDEMTAGDMVISLKTPVLLAGIETTLLVEVKNRQTGVPVSDARVSFQIKPQNQSSTEHAGHENNGELQALTSTEAGSYKLKHKFESAGVHEITVKVWIGNAYTSTMTVTKNVSHSPAGEEHSEGHSGTSTWVIIGGIGMVLMMAVMFAGGI